MEATVVVRGRQRVASKGIELAVSGEHVDLVAHRRGQSLCLLAKGQTIATRRHDSNAQRGNLPLPDHLVEFDIHIPNVAAQKVHLNNISIRLPNSYRGR